MILTPEERLSQAVKEMSNGTFRGLSSAASPFNPQIGGFNGIHQSLTDLQALPFIVVASDGTGDYTSIKTAIEADTDTLTGEGSRYIWVKPGTYDDSTLGFVDLGGRNVQVFAPTADMTPYTGTTAAMQSWSVDGITATGSTGFGRFEGISVQLIGAGARLLEAVAQTCNIQFARCVVASGGSAQAVFRTASTSQAVFTDCAVTLGVFRGAMSFGGQVRFFNCTGTNFSPSGGAATVTGSPNIQVISGDLIWSATLTLNGNNAAAQGSLILHGVNILAGSRNLVLDDIGNVQINDTFNRGANGTVTVLWEFTTNVSGNNRPNYSLQGNMLRDIDLSFIDATGSAENDSATVRVSGTYRTIKCEISRAVVDVILDSSGTGAALVYLSDAANTEACNFQIALRADGAGHQAWNLVGANHVLSLAGYTEATVASAPAPAAPPSVAVNGTHVFTITN